MSISNEVERSIQQITKGMYDLLLIWEKNNDMLTNANDKCEVNFASCFMSSLDELLSDVHQFKDELVANLKGL